MAGKNHTLTYCSVLFLAFLAFMISPFGTSAIVFALPIDEAIKIKEQGDRYARESNYVKAAEFYAKALSTPDAFSNYDRLDMAKVLAWAGNFDLSQRELKALLDKDPGFIKARVQLGRVLFWQEDMDEALTQADEALRQKPTDRDALILKADIFRVGRDFPKAISIYEDVLRQGEDFQARHGLASAYLASGNVAEAQRNIGLLAPTFPYQHQEIENLKAAIDQAEKPRTLTQDEAARQTLEKGNQLMEEGKHKAAAEQYMIALSLSKAFSAEEQLQMATVMSWAGSLEEARKRLSAILAENPSLIRARIQLARVLLWSGEFDAALEEIDKVLAVESGNRDALLVRANGLRMKRNYRPATDLYRELINKQPDYDVYEGLTYAYLLSNDRIGTDRTIPLLKPGYPYQEKSLAELKDLRNIKFRPSVAPGFSYYHDTDDNDVWRYFATGTVWFGNWQTSLDYVHIDADSPDFHSSTDNVILSTYSRMPFYGGLGGSIGLADQGRTVSWSVRGDIDIPDGSIGGRVGYDALTDTAEVMENRIRATNYSMYIHYRPTDRISVWGNYSYRDYSDNNYAHDLMGSISYLFLRRPVSIAVGYRARYLDFDKQTLNGYFDPNNFLSHILFANIFFERGRFYGYAEPYIGYQTYTRYEEGNNSAIGGFAGMMGYRFSRHFAAEANFEAGDYAMSSSGASRYYQVGSRLIINF
ncbi:MAG: tetratricopeptide repeat protein [Syntrophorhabdaceae bacterium]|nr:tetratricopeptide repeat protein [Syntrophorhabdaceae bacterium]MDD4195275.1 tetratricopeptide repeat protein [Syntrophorhabdaceae bacterium]